MKLVVENKRRMNEGAFGNFFKGPGYYEIYVYKIDEDGSYSDSFVWGGGAEYYDSVEDLETDLRKIENIPVRRYAYNIEEVKKVDDFDESLSKKRMNEDYVPDPIFNVVHNAVYTFSRHLDVSCVWDDDTLEIYVDDGSLDEPVNIPMLIDVVERALNRIEAGIEYTKVFNEKSLTKFRLYVKVSNSENARLNWLSESKKRMNESISVSDKKYDLLLAIDADIRDSINNDGLSVEDVIDVLREVIQTDYLQRYDSKTARRVPINLKF